MRKGHEVCMMCGKPHRMLNAHHLISRRVLAYRWDLNNARVLCPGCHKWCIDSAHISPWFLEKKVRDDYPDTWAWWVAHRWTIKELPSVKVDLEEVYTTLKEVDLNGNSKDN